MHHISHILYFVYPIDYDATAVLQRAYIFTIDSDTTLSRRNRTSFKNWLMQVISHRNHTAFNIETEVNIVTQRPYFFLPFSLIQLLSYRIPTSLYYRFYYTVILQRPYFFYSNRTSISLRLYFAFIIDRFNCYFTKTLILFTIVWCSCYLT